MAVAVETEAGMAVAVTAVAVGTEAGMMEALETEVGMEVARYAEAGMVGGVEIVTNEVVATEEVTAEEQAIRKSENRIQCGSQRDENKAGNAIRLSQLDHRMAQAARSNKKPISIVEPE